MKNDRKGFTLIELLIVVVIVGILALAAIPLITENSRDARRAEAEAVAGSVKTTLRAAYAKTGTAPASFAAAGYTPAAGAHSAAPTYSGNTTHGTIGVVMTATSDGTLSYPFTWAGGAGTFTWS
ncbi:prepilin-type N-terminal cleavage/methylation domain-containing protein [Planctomycetota bacterium]|nr:prepilin-type N-terminal cleavage/methylation domain-containing protein [Planctomycetota bacterium]